MNLSTRGVSEKPHSQLVHDGRLLQFQANRRRRLRRRLEMCCLQLSLEICAVWLVAGAG
ncbi:hypothetical protein ACS0TY_006343 [Phlomoides rotata]